MTITAKTARYIRPESATISSFETGNIRLGDGVTDELAKEGDLEKIEQYLVRKGYAPEAAADGAQEAKDFYSLGADCLWISFAEDHLWWTFADPQVVWVSNDFVLTGERVRISIGGWRKTDIHGEPLRLNALDSRIMRLATIVHAEPNAETLQALVRLINGTETQANVEAGSNSETGADGSVEHQAVIVQVPSKLFTVGDVVNKPSAAPDQAGIYAWWFDELPNVPLEGSWEKGGFRLAYVGIASYRPGSRRTLRQRLYNHCKGPIATSTLRRSLAAILIDELDLHPFVGNGHKIRLADGEEARLSAWLAAHGRVAWIADATPWVYETELLKKGPPLVLNIRGNNHAFVEKLLALRQQLSSNSHTLPDG
jgi:hypothetical protein